MHIFTRSRSEKLYKMFREFAPNNAELVPMKGYNGYEESLDYLLKITKNSGHILNIDEDCYVFDWGVVDQLVFDVNFSGAVSAGMPDQFVCPHRSNSPIVHNPFFNVFDADKIRELITANRDTLLGIGGFGQSEPFNGFFLSLWLKDGRLINIGAEEHTDGISTILKYKEKPFAIHTWYSRDYEIDEKQQKRIDKAYEYAKDRWKLQN